MDVPAGLEWVSVFTFADLHSKGPLPEQELRAPDATCVPESDDSNHSNF